MSIRAYDQTSSGNSLELGGYVQEKERTCWRYGENFVQSVEHVFSYVTGEWKRLDFGLSGCRSFFVDVLRERFWTRGFILR